MATASDVVTSALGYLLQREDEESVSTSDMTLGIDVLNDMMLSWSTDGLRVGYRRVSASTDDVSAPDAALMAIKQNLAVNMVPLFGVEPSPSLYVLARDSLTRLRNLVTRIPQSEYPNTLPRGSGNSLYVSWSDENFYDESSENNALIYFTGNASETTISDSTPTTINATWLQESASGFSRSAGVLTWSGKGITEAQVSASLVLDVATGTDELAVYVVRNGSALDSSKITKLVTSGTKQTVDFDYGPFGLATGDTLELRVANLDTTENITVSQATFEVVQCG